MFITDDRGGHRHKGKGNKEERRKRKQKRYQRGGSDGARFNLSGLKEGPRGPSATALHRPSVNHFHPRLATFKKLKKEKRNPYSRNRYLAHPWRGKQHGFASSHRVRHASKKVQSAPRRDTLTHTRGGRERGRQSAFCGWGRRGLRLGRQCLLLITNRLKVCDVSQSSCLAKRGGDV